MTKPTFAAHQPNFLPDLAFFYKMAQVDAFVLADDFQYTTHSAINRTRIKTADGWRWLTVPVLTKGRGPQKIREVRIANDENWQRKHLRALWTSYKNAPYFEKYVDFFAEIYSRRWGFLLDLNLAGIEYLRRCIGVDCPLHSSSTLAGETRGGNKIFALSRLAGMGCQRYLADAEAKPYLRNLDFAAAGVELAYVDFVPPVYHQLFGEFAANLSLVDVLFNEGDAAREVLLAER